jgi:hypothetical protein
MSQRDLVAELCTVRVAAPPEVRERVRLIAAEATPPQRGRFTWRRALVVAVPVAAAIAASIVFTRPSNHTAAVPPIVERASVAHGSAMLAPKFQKGFAVPASPKRVQTVATTLAIRVPQISDAVKRAVAVATSLGGYPASVQADTHGSQGTATLTLKVPRANLQRAITRLAQLGTITSEDVQIADRQAGLNTDERTIARLQKQLAATTDAKQRVALTTRIERLQRKDAATRRAAHYAAIHLSLATPHAATTAKHHHGPLHGVGVALTWLGIGAVYALAIGVPLLVLLALVWLAVRTVRRRREDALLSRP